MMQESPIADTGLTVSDLVRLIVEPPTAGTDMEKWADAVARLDLDIDGYDPRLDSTSFHSFFGHRVTSDGEARFAHFLAARSRLRELKRDLRERTPESFAELESLERALNAIRCEQWQLAESCEKELSEVAEIILGDKGSAWTEGVRQGLRVVLLALGRQEAAERLETGAGTSEEAGLRELRDVFAMREGDRLIEEQQLTTPREYFVFADSAAQGHAAPGSAVRERRLRLALERLQRLTTIEGALRRSVEGLVRRALHESSQRARERGSQRAASKRGERDNWILSEARSLRRHDPDLHVRTLAMKMLSKLEERSKERHWKPIGWESIRKVLRRHGIR